MAGFNEILAQEHIVNHFKNAIKTDKLSHAYIINGSKGSGKKTLAAAFAMAIQCGKSEPCGTCRSCKQSKSGNHPDIRWITYEKTGIGVDEIREQINNDIIIRPYSSRHKIYIMPDADKMTVQAQNALLKTIEEPPEYAVIILLTDNADVLLPTILSRCIVLKTKPVLDDMIKRRLMMEYGVPDYSAAMAAAFAGGNVGAAIKLVSSEDFNDLKNTVTAALKDIDTAEISDVISYVKAASEYKKNSDEYFMLARTWFKDVLVYKSTGAAERLTFSEEYNDIKRQADKFSYRGLERAAAAVDKAENRIRSNVNFENAVEVMFLSIIDKIEK